MDSDGEIPDDVARTETVGLSCHGVEEEEETEDAILKQYWMYETFGSREEKSVYHSKQEEMALGILSSTIRSLDKRYEIGLPWASPDIKLPDNRASALRRSYAKEARFCIDPLFARRYTAAIETNMTLGFVAE